MKFLLMLFCLFLFNSAWAVDNNVYNLKFDLSSWPKETQDNLLKNIPEFSKARFTDEELNVLIKKIYTVTRLKKIKIIKSSNALLLQAETDAKVDEIVFTNSPLISDVEAIEIMNLGLYDATDSNKVNYALDKLINYYKNLGYQKATGRFDYEVDQNFKKKLVITLNLGPKTIIQSLSFQGLATEDAEHLKNHIYWNFVGENLTDERLKKITTEIRTQLNSRGLFLVTNVSPQIIYNSDDTRVSLIYKFQNKPRYSIVLEGSKNYSEYNLKNDVLKLYEYTPIDESFPEEILSKLQKFYLSQGYNNNEIKYSTVKQADRNVLTYKIIENTKTFIYEIKILGNYSRSEKYYIKLFDDFASVPVQEGLFIKADIEQAAKNLVIALKNQGFISAKLKKLDLSNDIDRPERGLVHITIEEGAQTRISKINFKNNEKIDDQQLVKSMDLSSTTLLNLNELEAGLTKLQNYYANQGFLEMKVANLNSENLVQYSEDFSTAEINIEVIEGPKIFVNSILIDGNNQTHERVILNELEFKVGDVLTLQKLQESTARMQKTGLFSSLEIKTLEANTNVSHRTVLINVGERKPGIVTAGVGVTNENDITFRGYTGLAYRNLGGWGRGVSLRGEGSYNPTILNFLESKFTFGFLEPYLLDTRLRFRFNYTTSRTVTDYSIRQKTIANQGIWSIEQDISSNLTAIWQIYNVANFVDEGITHEDEIEHRYTRQDMVIASTGPTFDLDYRDNVLNPMRGNFSRMSLEYASSALGSNHIDDFFRATAQTTFYFNVYEQVVWANSLRGGYLHPLKTNPDYGVRFDKKGFILGGRSTIRGFESNEFFPGTNIDENPEAIGAAYQILGDSSYQLFKSEIRFPLFKKSDLSAAIFYDGGQVYIAGNTFLYKTEWRDAVGVGIRYNLPIGPLNLEYAHKLNKKSHESDGAFHLSVGVF